MKINGEKIYMYSPYEMKRATDEEIEQEVMSLIHAYNNDADTPFQLSENIEIISNINSLYGEVISRLQLGYDQLKFETDNKIDKNTVELRNQWVADHPKEKAPAMAYFEANARTLEEDKVKRYLKLKSDLNKFIKAYDSMENRMNAVKRKQDAIKYEEFGVVNG